MKRSFMDQAMLFKALADSNRLMIVTMLSGGELCACRILQELKITQPTLSHHMRILCETGLVESRKVGKWTYYSLNQETIEQLSAFLRDIVVEKIAPQYSEECGEDCC